MSANLKYLGFENYLDYIQNVKIDTGIVLKGSIIAITSIGLAYIGKIWYSYQFFKKRRLRSPKHEFFFGNFRQIIKKKNYSEVIRKWTQELGKTYGYFEGHQPVIVTSDLEIIQEVFIKQSSNFMARKKAYLHRRDNEPSSSLFESSKNRWKRMRMIMNPTFSSAKLRELGPILVTCTDRLIDVLNKEAQQEETNISQYFKRFTMDSIWNCAFGVDINMQYEKENEYFNKCEKVFSLVANLILPQYLGIYFHEFKELILEFLIIGMNIMINFTEKNVLPLFWLRKKVGEVIKKREKSVEKSKKKDYIQLLLDANANIDLESDKNFHYDALKKLMTTKEIEANLVLFMLAGYETTSTALSYASHVLATNQSEQEKLLNEITSVFGSDLSLVNSDSVQELQYLDWFVKEVLRYYPIGNSVVTRRCTKETKIKNIHIPVDTPIAVDVLTLHYDPEIWGPVDPNEFYPPRHEVKRNALAFMAFGNGPRNCIGMKFALIELKIALVKLILNFEFQSSGSNEIEFEEGVVRYPKYGVKLFLKKRIIN